MAEYTSEKHHELLEFYVCCGGAADASAEADGTASRPFAGLRQACESLAVSTWDARLPDGKRPVVELVGMRPGGQGPRPLGPPKYEFYVATNQEAGDGSELSPWPDMTAAMAALRELASAEQVSLSAGQRLRVRYREMFTATRVQRWQDRKERIAHAVFLMMAITCVAPVVAILGYLVYRAWPALTWEFLSTNPREFFTAGGIWSPLIGTFFLVLLSLLIAAPIGVLAGVYLNEYARQNWATRTINLAVVNLAGVPSIVHALFGVGAFVLFMGMGRSLLAASCTVAVMTLPVIITSTREALAAVPMSFREACWNLGASKWQTIRTIVLPNSVAGILTGVILQVARAAGETAPILFTGAVLFVPVADSGLAAVLPYSPTDRFMALSYHLFALSTQIRGASEESLFGTAVVLIGLVLLVNSLSIGIRVYLRRHKKW